MRPVLVCLVLVLVLTACGRASPPTPTPEPVEIRFVYNTAALTAHYERLKAEFEAANPGFTVRMQMANPYTALGSSGSAVDVAEIDQLSVAILANSGYLRSLDPLTQSSAEIDLDAFFPGAVDALRWGGQLWGLPSGVDPWVFYFNKELFDAKGVAYPTDTWTWDDMLFAAQQIADPGAEPPLYGLLLDPGRADFVPLVYQNGGTLVDSLVAPTTVTFTDMATIEAIEWYVGLSMSQGVAPTPRELSGMGGFSTAVMAGRAAMWYGPLSERGGQTWSAPWPFEWGIAAPPGYKARMTLITMRAYVMGAGSQRPGPAWEWLKHLAANPATTLDVPPLTAVAESSAYLGSQRDDVGRAALESMRIGHTIPATTWIDAIAGWLGQAMAAAFQDEMRLVPALEEAQQRAAAFLAQQSQ